jgi:hypothetical protein
VHDERARAFVAIRKELRAETVSEMSKSPDEKADD